MLFDVGRGNVLREGLSSDRPCSFIFSSDCTRMCAIVLNTCQWKRVCVILSICKCQNRQSLLLYQRSLSFSRGGVDYEGHTAQHQDLINLLVTLRRSTVDTNTPSPPFPSPCDKLNNGGIQWPSNYQTPWTHSHFSALSRACLVRWVFTWSPAALRSS